MKKLMIATVLGLMLVSCRHGAGNTMAVCVQANLVGEAVCEVASPAPIPAPDPVRERREPVMLLRILTEL